MCWPLEPQELANDFPLPVLPSQHVLQLCPRVAVAWVSLQGWVVVARVVSKEETFKVQRAQEVIQVQILDNLEFVRDKVRNFCETRSVLVLRFVRFFFWSLCRTPPRVPPTALGCTASAGVCPTHAHRGAASSCTAAYPHPTTAGGRACA